MKYILYDCYNDIINNNHTLIGGATGSGKSVLLNGLTYTLLGMNHELIFIDLKKVEFDEYKNTTNCLYYADSQRTAIYIFKWLVEKMNERYKKMKELKIKKSNDTPIWVIIDEYADLMLQCRKYVIDNINQLLIMGRASNIHLVIATQKSTQKILGDFLKINCDLKIALRVGTKQESRNIIEMNGAEQIKECGLAIYKSPMDLKVYKIKMIPQNEIQKLINYRAKND